MNIMEARPATKVELAGRRRVFWVLLAYKVLYLLAISLALLIHPEDSSAKMFRPAHQAITPEGYLTFDSHFASWDAEHYLFIAAHGYEAGAGRCAFYPLFPLAIRSFSLAGVSPLLAGMILANVFSLVGWFIFFNIVCQMAGESTAKIATILLLAFPGSLFFQFVYTESLFFLLLMLLLLGLRENWLWMAFTAAFLLPLTRAVGLFCIFPILWHVMTTWWPTRKKKIPLAERLVAASEQTEAVPDRHEDPTHKTNRGKAWLLLLAPVCGWALYLLLMKKWTGNAFEGFEAQKQFGVQSIANLFNVPHFISTLLTPTHFHEFAGSALDRCWFILLIYSLPIIWWVDKSWLLWALFLGIVPAMSGMFVSYTRFASVVFPLFVAMAVFLNKPGRLFKGLRFVAVATFAALQIILVWRFVNYRWAG
jgi:hypothetical protein